jgi:hypothetical protein
LCGQPLEERLTAPVGELAFVETITLFEQQPAELGWDQTIIFFNTADAFEYRCPETLVDTRSGVICLPNNYLYPGGKELAEGCLRVTALANHAGWDKIYPGRKNPEGAYQTAKQTAYRQLQEVALQQLPGAWGLNQLGAKTLATDCFTPPTVTRYTGHFGGAIYGSPRKRKSGTTGFKNLFICGTDQGFLGITGAMLSGISMANAHCLR